MMVTTGLVRKAENETQIRKLVDNCGSEHQKIWYTVFEVKLGLTSTWKSVWKGGQNVYRLMAVHVNHAIAWSACRSCRTSFATCCFSARACRLDFMGGDFNAFSSGTDASAQAASKLQLLCKTLPWPPCLGVSMRASMHSSGTPTRTTQNTSSGVNLYMAYRDKDIEEYRLKRDDILNEVTDATGESTKIPRLKRALQEYDENFHVIGLVSLTGGMLALRRSTSMTGITVRGFSSEQEHYHQGKVCSSVPCRSGANVPHVEHGSENHPTTSKSQIKRSGHAPCAQGRLTAMANTCRHEVIAIHDQLHHQV